MRRTYPSLQRLTHRSDFVCQHSNFNKSTGTKRASKNCGCSAKLTQKIKIVSRQTKQTDPHIKGREGSHNACRKALSDTTADKLPEVLQQANATEVNSTCKMFNTCYYFLQKERPFSDLPALVDL